MFEDERERLTRLKHNLERRATIYNLTRKFFQERGFLEVETPIRMSNIIPESQIVPFESERWFLSTSPELFMKRLMAAGYNKIFQFSRCFRKGERGRWHNPEFTLLEWYRSGAGCMQMVQDTEQLVITLARSLVHSDTISYGGQDIDLTLPWPEISIHDAFMASAGWDPVVEHNSMRFDLDLVTKVIPGFNPAKPAVLVDYPAYLASLSCLKPENSGLAERSEVFAGGLELANAYTELTNSQEQEKRFRLEIEQIEREQGRKMELPRRMLEAVAHLPACGGIALGMDRLVMLFCDADRIDDVIAFPSELA